MKDRIRWSFHNPRRHSRNQVRQIAHSIETFRFNVPILIGADSQVIAGHERVLVCENLGPKEVPAIRIEHLTLDQLRALTIADNRLTENSLWDDRLPAEQLKSLSDGELDFSVEVTGFDDRPRCRLYYRRRSYQAGGSTL